MNFIYADELKTKFKVYGHFYNLLIGQEIFHCRSVLEIISKDSIYPNLDFIDAIIIMMNPGSSGPININYVPQKYSTNEIFSSSWDRELVPTRPDNAQYQIMRLMLMQNWKYVRVLNLSDLRNGNSGKFSDDYNRALKIDNTVSHSIFHPQRIIELISYFNITLNSLVILAWGAETFLIPVANRALEFIKSYNFVGIPYNNGNPFFHYPSPYLKSSKLLWLGDIIKEIKTYNHRLLMKSL